MIKNIEKCCDLHFSTGLLIYLQWVYLQQVRLFLLSKNQSKLSQSRMMTGNPSGSSRCCQFYPLCQNSSQQFQEKPTLSVEVISHLFRNQQDETQTTEITLKKETRSKLSLVWWRAILSEWWPYIIETRGLQTCDRNIELDWAEKQVNMPKILSKLKRLPFISRIRMTIETICSFSFWCSKKFCFVRWEMKYLVKIHPSLF